MAAMPIGFTQRDPSQIAADYQAIRAEEDALAKKQAAGRAADAVNIGTLPSKGFDIAKGIFNRGVEIKDILTDVETIDYLYNEAQKNPQMVKDYAKARLGWDDRETNRLDPIIKGIDLAGKKKNDPTAILQVYSMVDKLAEAKKAQNKPVTGVDATVMSLVQNKFYKWAKENKIEFATSADFSNFLTSPEGREYSTAINSDTMKQINSEIKKASDSGLKVKDMEQKTADKIIGKLKDVAPVNDALRVVNAELSNADSELNKWIDTPVNNLITKKKQQSILDHIKTAVGGFADIIGKSYEGSMLKEAFNGAPQYNTYKAGMAPIQNLLSQYVKMISGSAATDGEVGRLMGAMGLTISDPTLRKEKLDDFIGQMMYSVYRRQESAKVLDRFADKPIYSELAGEYKAITELVNGSRGPANAAEEAFMDYLQGYRVADPAVLRDIGDTSNAPVTNVNVTTGGTSFTNSGKNTTPPQKKKWYE